MAIALEFLLDLRVLIVTCVLVAFFCVEKIWPQAPLIQSLRTRRARCIRWVKNLGLFGINALLAPIITIPLTAWADDHALLWRAEYTTGAWILLDLILLDCAIYWWHRMSHEIPFLWRFHQVHHLDEFLDTTSGVRFHFGEVILSALFRMIVIMLFGIDLISVIIFETILLVSTLFQHSNLAIAQRLERGLGFLIITPALHWVHHHAKQADTDSNYGAVLSIWDRLFRSRSKTVRDPNMRIGVEGGREKDFWGLILAPLQKKGK